MSDAQEMAQLEELLRSGNAGGFIDAVISARAEHADMVMMTVQAFAGESELLYAALRYAYLSGMEVRFAPKAEPA